MKLSPIITAGLAALLGANAHAYQSAQSCDEACKAQKQERKAARSKSERQDAKQRQLQLYEECLRKADWPGTPSRSECRAMHGK